MAQLLVLSRFFHFGAAMLLWGGAVYGGRPRFRAALWALVALTTLSWLALEAGIAGGGWAQAIDPTTISELLRETDFGTAWSVHGVLVIALGIASWLGQAEIWAAGLVLGSLALTGHAAMHGGWAGSGQRINAAVHLLASGFWLGALPRVFAAFPRLDDPVERERLERFSRMGHIAVALVILTGIINTALVLGHAPIHPGRPYEGLLDLKIAMVAAMIGLAVTNQYRFMPRLRAGGDAGALRRSAMAEIVLGALVLALVSIFATFDPT